MTDWAMTPEQALINWPGLDWLHPGLILILGAALIPMLPGRLGQLYRVILPLFALLAVVSMAPGSFANLQFLGLDLTAGRVDPLSLVFGHVFAIMATIGAIYALHVRDSVQHVAGFVYAGAALGAVFAGDLVTLYVFWELMMLSSVWLIWQRGTSVSYGAGFRYLIFHAVGGVALLAGIVAYYLNTGSIAFNEIETSGPAFWLILFGFIVNAAVPPLHAWLTDAYPEGTITGAVFLSAFTTKTAVYTLIRGYPDTEILAWVGAFMTLYGVTFAMLANDIRRLLSYHIVSQVGYMVAGVGLGTALALNGSAAHAFTHILYKALLFMGAGAVLYMTGRSKLSELGGLYRYMPLTLVLYMIGAFSIAAFPLFSGFTSKTMIVEASAEMQEAVIWLMLSLAAVGTFLSTGLKLPWVTFFGRDSGLRPREAPWNMLLAMGIAAFLCIFLGVAPQPLYNLMPTEVDYNAYTSGHVLWELQLLLFTAVGFFVLIKWVGKPPEPKINLDTDWSYRVAAPALLRVSQRGIQTTWATFIGFLQSQVRWGIDSLAEHHGPQGILSRTWPTGSMVLWVAVLLAASLLVYYL